jgi:hypothetical protein
MFQAFPEVFFKAGPGVFPKGMAILFQHQVPSGMIVCFAKGVYRKTCRCPLGSSTQQTVPVCAGAGSARSRCKLLALGLGSLLNLRSRGGVCLLENLQPLQAIGRGMLTRCDFADFCLWSAPQSSSSQSASYIACESTVKSERDPKESQRNVSKSITLLYGLKLYSMLRIYSIVVRCSLLLHLAPSDRTVHKN